jgi:hypothetical protein
LKVSAKEKSAALELGLPENFYAYKYKDDCPGCIGCQDSDKFIYDTTMTKQPELTEMSLLSFGSKLNDSLPSSTSQFTFNNAFQKPVTTTPTTTRSDSGLMIFGISSTKPIFEDGKEINYQLFSEF